MTDSFKAKDSLTVNGETFTFFNINSLSEHYDISRLPFSLKVLLENLLRKEDGKEVTAHHIKTLASWSGHTSSEQIAFSPSRVILQDFTGVPAVVDLAAMRDAMTALGADPRKINPQVPVDLVIDHSVMVDFFGSDDALQKNTAIEFERNKERYQFLKWGQSAFSNFSVVPPGTGIVHQVNLEYLANVVMEKDGYIYPDTLVGTDSHTTMINGLGVLGWGVGGIEAEAAMLGQPITMLIPEVVGFELTGELKEGVTATDLVLTVTQMLRAKNVVGKFVEFFGDGLQYLSLADRATISNMAPEYGATCGIFPIDQETLRYLALSGRDQKQIDLVEHYAKAQGLWRDAHSPKANYSDRLLLDMSSVCPSIAGPKRPQDRVLLTDASHAFETYLNEQASIISSDKAKFESEGGQTAPGQDLTQEMGVVEINLNGQSCQLKHGDVVIAAITSCTNTSNPHVMIAAGLLAQKAVELGLKVKPWVKTSLAPGSQVVPAYLEKAGLLAPLEALGFNIVGFGCTTCIGNSGPLPDVVRNAIKEGQLIVSSVLSGNRNFEGRIHADVKTNYLASPPLVVAYALAGSMRIDLTKEPLGEDKNGGLVYLKDIWPSSGEINEVINRELSSGMYQERYQDVFKGTDAWRQLDASSDQTYTWPSSTYINNPPYFENIRMEPQPLKKLMGARCLVKVGDSITTDHISPAGAIKPDSPAGLYLQAQGVDVADFNSLGSRRGNHEVMMRGTFANVRLRNQLAPGSEGSVTRYFPDNKTMSIFDAAMHYKESDTPLIVIAGKEYGTGSSRDWAAKGTKLLGVEAVIAQSFERIHRSNLVGFGVLPLQFKPGDSADSLGWTGEEVFSLEDLDESTSELMLTVDHEGKSQKVMLDVRIDTPMEWDYYRHGGILHFVLRSLAQ